MAKLDAAQRKKLPSKDFAGPGRSYPVENKGHAKAAKSRASEMERKGKLSKGAEAKIDAKANKELGKGRKKSATKHRFDRDWVVKRPDLT